MSKPFQWKTPRSTPSEGAMVWFTKKHRFLSPDHTKNHIEMFRGRVVYGHRSYACKWIVRKHGVEKGDSPDYYAPYEIYRWMPA